MEQKLKPTKSLRAPLLKIQNSTCYAVTNLELTSSCNLSLLSPNSYTSNSDITCAVTHQKLSKKTPHNSRQDFLLKSHENYMDRIASMEDSFKDMEMSIAPRGKR